MDNFEYKTVLVTGGLGYIGSHITIELIKSNCKVIIVDNLFNSTINGLTDEKIKEYLSFYNCDIAKQESFLDNIFYNNQIDHVIHMASYKSVSESIENPVMYYSNNINCLLNLLTIMKKNNVKNIIFSSSATVYGDSIPPFNENSEIGKGLTNPYGKSKYFCEEILRDIKDMDILIQLAVTSRD